MKNVKRIFVITFMLAFILSISSINAFAATVTQDNLEVTLVTDKEKYSENEQIKTTLTVKNNNDTAVTNVDLETALPDGYKLADKSENKKTVDSIAAGESVSLDVTLEKDNTKKESTPSEPSTDAKSSTNPVSGGNSGSSGTTTSGTTTSGSAIQTGQVFLVVGIILLLLLTSGVTFIFLYRKKHCSKQATKGLLSVILCCGIVCSTCFVSHTIVSAFESSKAEAIIRTCVKVSESNVEITGKISYNKIDRREDVFTVTFNSNGGSPLNSIKVMSGNTLSAPISPKKDGYIFVGWYTDSDFNEMFLFDDEPIINDITLYAKWIKDDPDSLKAEYITENILIQYQNGDNSENVTRDIELPEIIEGVSITWESSNPEIIDSTGKVTRTNDTDIFITLTASITVNDFVKKKSFDLTVIRKRTETPIDDQTVVDIQNLNHGNEVDIEYNDDQTQVVDIDGKYSDKKINNSEDAIDAIQGIRSMLGLSNAYDELGLFSSSKDSFGASYAFYQYYNNIRVYGRSVSVSSNEDKETDFLHSNIINPSVLHAIDNSTFINADEAESAAKSNFGSDSIIDSEKTECVIYSFDEYEDNPTVAYIVFVSGKDSSGNPVENQVIVNAKTKDIISNISLIQDDDIVTGSGKDELGNKVSFPITFTWHDWFFYYMFDPSTNVQVYKKELINEYRVGSEFNVWNDKQEISAYVNMIKIINWWKTKFNRNSLDGRGMKVDIVTHDNTYTNNAYWSSNKQRIYITDISGSIVKHTRAVADDVITHESTHAVLEYELGTDFAHCYENAPGAINEGYADVFGCLQNNNWTHGENLYNSSSLDHGNLITCTRNIANPSDSHALSQGPDKMSSERYIDYTVDSSDNGGVHTNGFLVSHAAYLMNQHGISMDKLRNLWYQSIKLKRYNRSSTFTDVRKALIKAAKKIHMTDQELAVIRKSFDEEEIFDEKGKINIRFTDESGNAFPETLNASVSMQRNKEDTPQAIIILNTDTHATTGIDNTYFGTYKTKVSVEGYLNFESNVEIKTGKTTELVIPLIKAGDGTVRGTITSATTGYPVDSVLLNVYHEWNQTGGSVVSSTSTDENGTYSLTLPAGYYTVEMSKDGYATGYFNLTISGGKTINNKNASISPIMTFGKDFRVVLTWGANPSDLDSHLFGQQSDGSNYHIYYSNKNGYDSNGNKIANLDVDDTTSFGPETTTFTAETAGSYEYYIDWYTGSGTWATCGGKVEVYNGDKLMYVFNVPNNNTKSGSWKVFTFKNGIFNPINVIQAKDIY